jgi:hypothetical protein
MGVEKGSLYSLSMNATASVVLSGSTERVLALPTYSIIHNCPKPIYTLLCNSTLTLY